MIDAGTSLNSSSSAGGSSAATLAAAPMASAISRVGDDLFRLRLGGLATVPAPSGDASTSAAWSVVVSATSSVGVSAAATAPSPAVGSTSSLRENVGDTHADIQPAGKSRFYYRFLAK